MVHNVLVLVQVKAAHVAHVKLKTMRHPNVLKYMDGVEVCHYLLFVNHVSADDLILIIIKSLVQQ